MTKKNDILFFGFSVKIIFNLSIRQNLSNYFDFVVPAVIVDSIPL